MIRALFVARSARWLPILVLALLPSARAQEVGAVRLQDLSILPAEETLQRFRIEFDRTATLRVHDALIDRHYFYLDFYDVAAPGPDRDWSPGGGVFHVKQLYYASQRVLRFVFYCRGDAWFAVQTRGRSIHEVQVRPIAYADFGRVADGVAGSRKKVVIDPGHGGSPGNGQYHLGAQTTFKVKGQFVSEKDVTLQIARRLEALVRKSPNLDVAMTRDDDRYVSLERRIDLARQAHGDLFVSIHLNAAGRRAKTARGFEIYYLSDGSKETDRELVMLENEGVNLDDTLSYQESLRDLIRKLADEAMGLRQSESRQACEVIGREFVNWGPFRAFDRGVKSAPFRVLMNFEMPAVLVECGFLDHPVEGRQLLQPDVQQRIAVLLFNGINRYFAMQDPDFRPARAALSP